MTGAVHRWHSAGAVVLVLLGSVLLAGPAAAQPAVGAGDSLASSTDADPEFLKLTIDKVAPSVVTETSPPFLAVTATVRNVGDRPVEDVDVRIQRAPAILQPAGLRTSLQLDQTGFDTVGDFVTVSARLDPGQERNFTLAMPLRVDPNAPTRQPTLQITEPGVYPLLLNANGTPEFGDPARLDDARFLVPVLGLPPIAGASGAAGAAVLAPTNAPVASTMLWPLADEPRLAAGYPGAIDQPVRLVDDDLTTSLATGGRLDGLVSALEKSLGPAADPDGRLASSLCLAVDPDLLVTVDSMTRGYLVPVDPDEPDGAFREGTGAAEAAAWLERVRALAAELCTVAVPFAQADVEAVAATDNTALARGAISAPADIVDSLLTTRSLRGVTWPDAGSIDTTGADLLTDLGISTVLLAGNAVTGGSSATTPELVTLTDGDDVGPASDTAASALRAATYDVPAATALAAVGADPQTPSAAPARYRYDLADDSRTARLQDALGALSWAALEPQHAHSRTALYAPPQRWSPDAGEAGALLAQFATLLRTGLATTRPFTALLGGPPATEEYETNYLAQADEDAVPEGIRAAAADQAERIDWLMAAFVEDPQRELTPQRYTAPLREDLLRALSLSGRRDADSGAVKAAQRAADERVAATTHTVDGMVEGVTVLAPGGVYTLASESSPLLLVARNDLAVPIRVLVDIDAPPAMTVADIGEQILPPMGSRTLQVPAKVSDSINLAVDVSLTTPDGHALGEPTTVSVRSNAYGRALAILTGCAGALLFLLAGRRLWHRYRGEPDPADEGYEGR